MSHETPKNKVTSPSLAQEKPLSRDDAFGISNRLGLSCGILNIRNPKRESRSKDYSINLENGSTTVDLAYVTFDELVQLDNNEGRKPREKMLQKLAAAGHLYVIGEMGNKLGKYYCGDAAPGVPAYRIPEKMVLPDAEQETLRQASKEGKLFVDIGTIEQIAMPGLTSSYRPR